MLAASVAPACGDDLAGSSAGSGGSSSAAPTTSDGPGGGGAAHPYGPYAPEAYLDPSRYDCRADAAAIAPPERLHAVHCALDRACTSRLVTAHRMATSFAPENTRSALRAAILLGADIAETDVRLTKDGVVVLVHDSTIDRTLEGSGELSAFTLDELRALAVRPEQLDPDGDWSCERVTTLEEAIATARGKIVVELETKETAAGVAAAEWLRDHDALPGDDGSGGVAYLQCAPDECDAIRTAVPDAPIMVRVTSDDDLVRAEQYDPPPLLVEVDSNEEGTRPEVLDRLDALGAKPFTNAFSSGDALIVLGDYSLAEARYLDWYDRGIHVLQTEFPHVLLTFLGRLPRPEVAP